MRIFFRGTSANSKGLDGLVDVLQSVEHDWNFMASEGCVPVQVALQLMDTSTVGEADREPDFLRMRDQIQNTLKSVVNGWFATWGAMIDC